LTAPRQSFSKTCATPRFSFSFFLFFFLDSDPYILQPHSTILPCNWVRTARKGKNLILCNWNKSQNSPLSWQKTSQTFLFHFAYTFYVTLVKRRGKNKNILFVSTTRFKGKTSITITWCPSVNGVQGKSKHFHFFLSIKGLVACKKMMLVSPAFCRN
jgi:hypothetical protein